MPFSLFLFVTGLVLLYYVLYANRGHVADFADTWNSLGVVMRLVAVVGFAASVSGVGGILDHMLATFRRQ